MGEAFVSLFLSLPKITLMKLLNYLLVVLLFVSACKKDTKENTPVLPADYGGGMYIVTENGISFYNYKDSLSQVKNQIFRTVNNTIIINPMKIKFKGTKAYIVTDHQIITANIETFESKEEINGFTNAVDFDFVSYDRLFVVDKGDSKVKVVDLSSLDITTQIETGDSTQPVFIVSNSYKSFVLNGGELSMQIKDSTVIVIEYPNNLVQLADFTGNLIVSDNPNSAVFSSNGGLKVLCQGVYDPINSMSNTESSLSDINQYSNQVYSINALAGIYNAQNLIVNWDNSVCYFTAIDGIYSVNPNTYNTSLVVNVNSDVITTVIEEYEYADTDTTTAIGYSNMLYMNDLDNPGNIYKYDLGISIFSDTIVVDGAIKDIAFY